MLTSPEILKCPVCNAASARRWRAAADLSNDRNGPTFEYRRCGSCQVGYLVNPPNDLSASYRESYYAFQTTEPINLSRAGRFYARGFGYRVSDLATDGSIQRALARLKAALESRSLEVAYHLPRARYGGKLLDVGCGSGQYLDLARSLDWETYGVEASATAAALARAAGHEVVVGDISDATFPPGSFDHVQFWHSLEHVRDPIGALRRIHPWLKATGTLAIAAPNADCPGSLLFGDHWFNLDAPRHLFAFNPTSIARVLTIAGFRVRHLRMYSRPADWTNSLAFGPSNWERKMASTLAAPIPKAILGLLGRLADAAGRGEHLHVIARPV